MPLLNDVMKELLHLVEESPIIATATCADTIYRTFSNSPYLPAKDAEEGIWLSVNKKLDGLFGSDNGLENVRKGPEGMALVIKYVNQAREHPTWDSPEDQQKRLQKMGNYDSTSDQLMKLKFKRVIEKLWELGKSSPKDHPPAKSSTNPAKGVKRRMVSNPTSDPNVAVAQEPKPPPKRQHNVASTSTAILILSDDEILAEDNEVVFIKSNVNTASQKKQTKQKKKKRSVILLCPLSKLDNPCVRCKIERHPKGQALKCHCGSAPVTLHGGRFERAEAHWLTDKCAKTTAQLRSNKLLSSFFVKDPALQPVNRNIIEAACPGLTDKTWPRPKSERTIAEFMDSTCTIYRGNVRHKILKELFGDDLGENDLTESQKAKLVTELDARSTWEVKRHGERNAIYSTSCKRTVNHHKKDPLQPCDSCLELKDLSSLRRALNHKYAKGDNKKFTPNYLLVIDKYNTIVNECKEVKILGKSLESSRNGDFGDFLDHLAIMARRGIFENRQAVKGMIMGCAIRAEREEAGKSLRGMRIDTHLNDCLTTLGAMSKSALKLLTENFVGKTLRCQRMDRARSKTEIEDGMVQGNFDRAAAILTELGYSGPVAVGSDQTVCVQTLRHHRGFIVGAQGGDIPFGNPDELQKMLEKIKKQNNLCSKIRAYTIQVPLPNIPTLVVALLASASDEGADEISVLHDNMIRMSQASGINVLSIGADGAANEIAAQVKLNQMTSRFLTYSNNNLNVHIKVPLFGNPPRPVVTLQDPKHARKTGANQLLSGSRLITMGKFVVSLQDLSQVLQTPNSPLLTKDVFDCDKQDDGRALRTFCSQTVATTLARDDCYGLTVYLFIIGELCDAWLNKTMGHCERIRAVWTAGFFLRIWKEYLLKCQKRTNGLMSFHLNSISHASFKIFSNLAESFLALIISHRDYYPDFPFCPWKHGTEACEHIFGWMRVISPNFSVLDARLMMPKIMAVVKSIMSGRMKMAPSEHVHAGYQYDLRESDINNLDHLRNFPSNSEITLDLTTAKKRAVSMAEFCGMVSSELEDLDHDIEDIVSSTVDKFQEDYLDISTSASKDYEVRYGYEFGEFPENEAFEAAARLTKEQNALAVMLDQVPDALEDEVVQNAAMSISNLLNSSDEPEQPNAPASPVSFCEEALVSLTIGEKLDLKNILELRKRHDSQVAKNKGNDRMLTNAEGLSLELNSRTNDGSMKPSACSKAIAVFMKTFSGTPAGAARRHRWNIHVKLDLVGITKNTSTERAIDTQHLFDGGSIGVENPIEPGKFLILIKNNALYLARTMVIYEHVAGRHAFVTSATSRKKLSHIGVQILYYKPGLPVATATEESAPDTWTYALLDAPDILYVFKPSDGSNFAFVEDGCYSIPMVIRNMLRSININKLVERYNSERKKSKSIAPEEHE